MSLLLQESSLTLAFGYAGTSELELCNELLGMERPRLLNSRGDKEAVFFAAGANVDSPHHAAALLHGARGLTNALGGIAEAKRNEVGLLVLVGVPSTASARYAPPHGEPGLLKAVGAFSKFSLQVGSDTDRSSPPEGHVLVEAFTHAVSELTTPPYGPAVIGIPQDVLENPCLRWSALRHHSGAGLPRMVGPLPDRSALLEATTALRTAGNVVVLLDDYFLRYKGSSAALHRFTQLLNASVLQLGYRRGAVLFPRVSRDEVPNFVDWYDPYHTDHRRILHEADLIVTLEDRNMYPRNMGVLPDCRKIAVSSDPSKAVKNGYLAPGDIIVEGEPVQAVIALSTLLHSGSGTFPGLVKRRVPTAEGSVTVSVAPDPREHCGRCVVDGLAQGIRGCSAKFLVDDSQIFGALIRRFYDLLPDGLRIIGSHGGFVGSGIPHAIGVSMRHPCERVFCTLGDQGFNNAFQSLVSAVDMRSNVTFVVCDNGMSVSLASQAEEQGLRTLSGSMDRYLGNSPSLEYTSVANALGLRTAEVDFGHDGEPGHWRQASMDLGAALVRLSGQRGPALLRMAVPPSSGIWKDLWPANGVS
ncbi:thiamine pyrophosphate-dependent acetolactate synthase large subunit-like protein [Nocardiopsis arvandica]|uniref:Thiamine pyrophosphate-dependent acetolactate synthase large subunit-like protein n=1 Tax=Nocardiopsis sinuspersici TaxID=501010 RepID=A0A7Z0BGD9_9ACTN|nr:thiamine pyrophosphate-dependent acetolactate synthase large subunit-like protein [Nocardiopsis sinuspersici]